MVQWSNGPMVQWSNGPEGPVDRTCLHMHLELFAALLQSLLKDMKLIKGAFQLIIMHAKNQLLGTKIVSYCAT